MSTFEREPLIIRPRSETRSPENKDDNYERLQTMLKGISDRVNEEAARSGLSGLLDEDGSINMSGYARMNGGIYDDEAVLVDDQEKLRQREIFYSGIGNENTRDFYRRRYRAKDEEGMLRAWRENKAKSNGGLAEGAMTGLFHKVKGLLSVHASRHDDLINKTDNLILNRETGELICAFDEVHVSDKGERAEMKQRRVLDIAKRGGTRIRHGLGMRDGRLVRTEARNVPLFCLELSPGDLAALLQGMDYDPDSPLSPIECEILGKLADSLREQRLLIDRPEVPKVVRDKLPALDRFLALIGRQSAEVEKLAA